MRAKYISKTARRRSIRPDGDHYREMRRVRGDVRSVRRRRIIVFAGAVAAVVLAGWIVYAMFLRS